jgi:pimeloyl-ACP methyl ester carboxylesterase
MAPIRPAPRPSGPRFGKSRIRSNRVQEPSRRRDPRGCRAHSVGGAIAVLFAGRHPKLTKSLTSIEGNLTLDELLGRDFQGDGSRLDPGAADPCSHIGAKTLDLLDEPVDVVAHSVGGAIAVLFAGRHPKLTKSLTSIEGLLSQLPGRRGLVSVRAVSDQIGCKNRRVAETREVSSLTRSAAPLPSCLRDVTRN